MPSEQSESIDTVPGVTATEVRVLDGPNLYFTRPAIKVSLALPALLTMRQPDAAELAERAGLRYARPGKRGTALRQRFVMRLARQLMRRIGQDVGVGRMGVRVRPGSRPEDIVVAFTWVRRGKAIVAGEQLAEVMGGLLDPSNDPAELVGAAARVILETPDGPPPAAINPAVPVASITGTNGKTTTTRLVAHMCMTAGLTTAWSSTDGIVAMGQMVEPGDYSGPAGARGVLETPGLDIGILETARGGMLLKGMGVRVNDVSVVTNVSADHLGLHGIDTLDQLAEVKAIVTTVTKPGGWAVLNGDDPRVWAMRSGTKAQPWVFTLDPASPAIWESLNSGGRAITVVDDFIVVQSANGDPDRLIRVTDVPMTMFGLSRINVANALAGTAAALGLGVPRAAVIDALRTFAPDPAHNSGRLNTYSLPRPDGGSVTVIVDMAHNEAGLDALLDVAHGLCAPGAAVRLGLGTGGDRTDDMLRGLGRLAARTDDGVIKHTPHYLRGRDADEVVHLLQEGLGQAGVHVSGEVVDDELAALVMLTGRAHDGDVVAIMCHEQRSQLEAWLADQGASVDDPATIRRKVVTARGEHELEPDILALHAIAAPEERVDAARALSLAHPDDARLRYELGIALDAAHDPAAVGDLVAAVDAGLGEPYAHRALIAAAVASAREGDLDVAQDLLDRVLAQRPGQTAALVARAAVRQQLGRYADAVADLMQVALDHPADAETARLRAWLRPPSRH